MASIQVGGHRWCLGKDKAFTLGIFLQLGFSSQKTLHLDKNSLLVGDLWLAFPTRLMEKRKFRGELIRLARNNSHASDSEWAHLHNLTQRSY